MAQGTPILGGDGFGVIDSKLSSASDYADDNASSGVAFGPWGMSTGLVQSGVFVAKHVYLNVCDSDYDLAVMVTLALVWVWALGLVPEVPGLGQMLSLMWSDMWWCWVGQMLDSLWKCLCLLVSIFNDV